MAEALRACGRDIVYSLSNTAPLVHGREFAEMANCWRTTGDIRDDWQRPGNTIRQFVGIVNIWDYHETWRPICGPGHYPDADMLVVGKVGWKQTESKEPVITKLTADEQYTHISLWCLWSSPMLIGCPIDQMDDFTLSLLSNDEVLEVHQDPLCRMAKTVYREGGTRYVLVKDMEDGSLAVGLFNRGDEPMEVSVPWSVLGVEGSMAVRDLWRQKDLGVFENEFSATVNSHGVVLVRMQGAEIRPDPSR